MPSTHHTLGPGHFFVRFRGDTTGYYLGTNEIAAKVQVDIHSLEVMNDLVGRSTPSQKVVDGERHVVSLVLNRFDYVIWKAVRDTYYHRQAITAHGTDDRWKRGSLLMGIGDIQLIHIHDFSGVAPAHPLTLSEHPVGRLYFSAELAGYVEDPSANRVQTIAASFKCDGLYDPTTRNIRTFTEVASEFGALGTIT